MSFLLGLPIFRGELLNFRGVTNQDSMECHWWVWLTQHRPSRSTFTEWTSSFSAGATFRGSVGVVGVVVRVGNEEETAWGLDYFFGVKKRNGLHDLFFFGCLETKQTDFVVFFWSVFLFLIVLWCCFLMKSHGMFCGKKSLCKYTYIYI